MGEDSVISPYRVLLHQPPPDPRLVSQAFRSQKQSTAGRSVLMHYPKRRGDSDLWGNAYFACF